MESPGNQSPPDPRRQVLETAAVIGDPFPLEALLALGAPEEMVGKLIDAGRWSEQKRATLAKSLSSSSRRRAGTNSSGTAPSGSHSGASCGGNLGTVGPALRDRSGYQMEEQSLLDALILPLETDPAWTAELPYFQGTITVPMRSGRPSAVARQAASW